ncbi:MAG: response regulator transcription factor [Sterolibacteriaceae bacterium MAG5]|nr:response regulator transcription factor [Candidatus Nitricoxidireducens bremensis]
MIRLLLAEDHALVRDGLRLLISTQPDMTLLADTDDGNDVIALTRLHCPDILLLDLGLPNLDGIAIMAALSAERLPTRVLVVTARLSPASVRASLELGAAGYLPKSEDSDELLAAVRRVAAGHQYVSPEVAQLCAAENADAEAAELAALTDRERVVLAHVGAGLSSKEIARILGISDLTVRKHRENLCRKLGSRNAAELIATAVRNGLGG